MSDKENPVQDFASFVQSGEVRDAVSSIMGESPVGIERSQNLLLQFDQLQEPLQHTVLEWAKTPLERLPVTDQRWYVEEISRHEIAHIIVAKALGFRTGEVTLVLNSRDGSHVGTSEVFLECVTSSIAEVSTYVCHRIMVLLAGAIAEPADRSVRIPRAYDLVRSEGAASDLQKVFELIRLQLNITGIDEPTALDNMLRGLVIKTSQLVEANFSVIEALSERFSSRIKFYGQRIGWEGSEIDAQPEIRNIVFVQ